MTVKPFFLNSAARVPTFEGDPSFPWSRTIPALSAAPDTDAATKKKIKKKHANLLSVEAICTSYFFGSPKADGEFIMVGPVGVIIANRDKPQIQIFILE
jgi:hypothetical protein